MHNAVAFNPTSSDVAVSSTSGTWLWDRIGNHASPFGKAEIVWHPDGQRFARNSKGQIEIGALDQLTVVTELPGEARHKAWSPDGKLLAYSHRNPSGVALIDEAGKVAAKIETGREVHALSWSSDSKRLAISSEGGHISIHDTNGAVQSEFRINAGTTGEIAWHPSTDRIAVHGGMQIFDGLGKQIARFRGPAGKIGTGYYGALCWNRDGSLLLASDYSSGDSELILWASDGTILNSASAHTDQVYSLDWSRDGKQFASWSYDGTAIIWNAETFEPEWTAVRLPEGQTASFSAAGELLFGDPEVVEREFVYIIEDETGSRELLTHSQFVARAAAQ